MAGKKILIVGVRKQKKRWELTVEGTDKKLLEILTKYIQVMAESTHHTIMGSNPLVHLDKDEKEKIKTYEEELKL